jgi:aconitate hydratase
MTKQGEYDLKKATEVNKEVYDFLASVSAKYGIGTGLVHWR